MNYRKEGVSMSYVKIDGSTLAAKCMDTLNHLESLRETKFKVGAEGKSIKDTCLKLLTLTRFGNEIILSSQDAYWLNYIWNE